MSYFIDINGVPNSPQRVVLNGNAGGTLGSAITCQIPIDHEEVSEQALLLDVRGEDFWIQNLNPYSIYIGMEEVTPNAWGPWAVGETIQLTKNVSLTIGEQVTEEGTADAEATDESKLGLDAGKIAQIALIAVCFIGAPLLLFTDNDEVGGVIDKKFNFNQVVSDLKVDADEDIEYLTVRKYLQQAWMADRRFRQRNRATVIKSYELLVNHRLIRNNPDNNETLDEIGEYAKRRLASLRYQR